jgi:hypothetical protein
MSIKKIFGLISIASIFIALTIGSIALFDSASTFEVISIQEVTLTFYNDENNRGSIYIHVFEQEKPLYIPSFVNPNNKLLSELEKNAVLTIGYIGGESDNYDKEIVYMYHEGVAILTLEDYIEDQQNNLYIGSVTTGIMAILMIVLWLAYFYKKPMPKIEDIMLPFNDDEADAEPVYVEPVPGIEYVNINLFSGQQQYKPILNALPEQTIQFNYLKDDTNHETAIVFYRIGKQLVAEYVFYDGDHYLLEIYDDSLEYSYPRKKSLGREEYKAFTSALSRFSLEKDIQIVIDIVRDIE